MTQEVLHPLGTADLFVKRGVTEERGEKLNTWFNVSAKGLPQPGLTVAVMVGYNGFALSLSQADAVNLRNALTGWLDRVAQL